MATRLDAATSASGTSLSYSISAGSNRLLVVMVQQENDGGSTPTCTYGGQSPISTPSGDMDVQINPGTTSQRVTVFFFDEAAIAAAGSTTISVGNVGGGDQTVHAASYQDAAQQVPTNTNSDSSTTSSPNPLTGTDVTTSGDDSVIGAASGQGNTGDCTWTGTTEQTQQAAASSNGSYSDVEVSSASTAVQPRCTWTSPNRQVVVSFEIEHGTSEGITDLDTSYGTAANELDFDDTDVDINGANFEASQGSGAIYLSDASTLAGGSNEVDISSAVNTWADIVVNLDFSQLSQSELDDLHTLGPGTSRWIILVNNSSDEYSLQIALHRPHGFQIVPSSNVTNGAASTPELTPPSGKSSGDHGGGRTMDTANEASPADDLAADEYREDLWNLQAKAEARETLYHFITATPDGELIDTAPVEPIVTITAGGPSITSLDSTRYGAASDEFDVDDTDMDLNVTGADASGNEVYLSPDTTLAGGPDEIDISAAINTEGTTLLNLDLSQLSGATLAAIEALFLSDGHDLNIILNASGGEAFLPVTVHRALAFQVNASTFIAASGEDTTARMDPPPGKTAGDFGGGRIADDEDPLDTVDIDINEYREDALSSIVLSGAALGQKYFLYERLNGADPDVSLELIQIQVIEISTEPEFAAEEATESDVGQDIAFTAEPSLAVEGASEVDTASDVTMSAEPVFNVENASEVDTASDVVLVTEQALFAEQASEVNTASDVTLIVEPVLSVEQGTESDVATDIDLLSEPALDIEQAAEGDAANEIILASDPVLAIEKAIEVDTASDVGFGPEISLAIEEATEVDTAEDLLLIVEPVFVAEQGMEADAASDIALVIEPTFDNDKAVESNAALDAIMAADPVFLVEEATEIDIASDISLEVTAGFNVEQAAEIDIAQDVSFAVEPVFLVEVVAESDVANEVSLSVDPVLTIEEAIEIDSALDVELSPEPLFNVEPAFEVDSALDVGMDAAAGFTVERASEVDAASEVILSPELLYSVEKAIEVDSALDVVLSVEPIFNAELATETDVAEDVVLEAVISFFVEQASEVNTASDVQLVVEPQFNVENATTTDVASEALFSVEPIFATEQATETDSAEDVVFEVDITVEPEILVESATEVDQATEATLVVEPAFLVDLATEINIAYEIALTPPDEEIIDTILASRTYSAKDREYRDEPRSLALITRTYQNRKRS